MANEKANGRQYAHPAGPVRYLWLLLLVPVNLVLILAVQVLFIHTHDAPLTPESVAALPEFAGCEILDVAGPHVETSDMMGAIDPGWVLYRNAAGETRAVRVNWSLILPRYRIEKNKDFLIPADETPYTFTTPDFPGEDTVTVTQGQYLAEVSSTGYFYRRELTMTLYVLLGVGLLLAEAAVYYFLRSRKRRKNGTA